MAHEFKIKNGLLVSGSVQILGPTTITGSLTLTTGESVTADIFYGTTFSGNANTATTASYALIAQTASFVATAQTASYVVTALTASYVTASNIVGTVRSSSYAANGGVTQIIAGTNIVLSPSNGLGAVTITSTGGGSSGAGANVTASFTSLATWTFAHGLSNQGVVVQTYDTNWNQIIPQNITLTDANTATISFPSSQSGYAIASLGGVATTASFVTTLNQNVIITGSVAIGTGSIGNGENNLLLGPAPAGGTGEGGQLALLAVGGAYTSSSFIDTYQNQFRILSGPGATSNTGVLAIDLSTRNATFQGAVTASGFSGLPNDYLYVTRNTDQTVGSNWASTDIIFNNSVVSKGISYNTGTGLASLTGGKVYRITARLAWSAAQSYLLEFSCYNSSNTQLGPTTQIVQSTNGSFNISDGTLDFIYAPGSNVDIKIRTTANTTALSGEKIRGDLNTQLIIQQIA